MSEQTPRPEPPGKDWFDQTVSWANKHIVKPGQGALDEFNKEVIAPVAKAGQDFGSALFGNGQKDTPPDPSINAKTVNIGGFDPIQGFDVGVFVRDTGSGQEVLLGQFTSIEVLVKVASEPYKAVGHHIPIYLDGEMQISFTLEKGLLDINVFEETFGFKTLDEAHGYFRTPRFEIRFVIDPVDSYALSQPAYVTPYNPKDASKGNNTAFSDSVQTAKRVASGAFILRGAKIDEWGIGSKSGRQIVVNQWKGVAQAIETELKTDYKNLKPSDQKNQRSVPTFYFGDFGDFASTTPLPQMQSYQLYPDWLTPENILRFEKQLLLGDVTTPALKSLAGFGLPGGGIDATKLQIPDWMLMGLSRQRLAAAIDKQLEAAGNNSRKSSATGNTDNVVVPPNPSKTINEAPSTKSELMALIQKQLADLPGDDPRKAELAQIWINLSNGRATDKSLPVASGTDLTAQAAELFNKLQALPDGPEKQALQKEYNDLFIKSNVVSKAINQEPFETANRNAQLTYIWNKLQNSKPGSAEEAHWAKMFSEANPTKSYATGSIDLSSQAAELSNKIKALPDGPEKQALKKEYNDIITAIANKTSKTTNKPDNKIVTPRQKSEHNEDTEPEGINTFSTQPVSYKGGPDGKDFEVSYTQSNSKNQNFTEGEKTPHKPSSALQDANGNPMTKIPVKNDDGTNATNDDGTVKTQVVPLPMQDSATSVATNEAKTTEQKVKPRPSTVVSQPINTEDAVKSKAVNQTFRPFITKPSYTKE